MGHRVVLRGLCALSVSTFGLLVALSSSAAADPPLTCRAQSGVVRDIYDEPVAGVLVTADSPSCGAYASGLSAADGAYTVYVALSQLENSLVASKDGYESATVVVPAVAAPEGASDFALRFEIALSASPQLARPGDTITISALTLSPPDRSTVAGSTEGSSLSFGFVSVGSDGRALWTASHVLPPALADGPHIFEACAYDSTESGTCADAQTGGYATTPTRSGTYQSDGTAPVLVDSTSGRYGVVNSLPNLSVIWTDPIAGVDPQSVVVSVDGAPKPVTTTVSPDGKTVTATTPASAFAPGIHVVDTSAADLLNNVRTDRYVFTVATLGADAAVAYLNATTAQVNPSGAAVVPETVTFTNVPVSVDQYNITLNASTRSGWSEVSRDFDFLTVPVEFRSKIAGTDLVTVALVQIPRQTVTARVAVLSPSSTQLSGFVLGRTVLLPNIAVPVPLEHRTPGNRPTATILERQAALTPPSAGPRIFPTPLPNTLHLTGSIISCARHGANACAFDEAPYVRAYSPATGYMAVYSPLQSPQDTDLEATARPRCLSTSGGTGGCVNSDPSLDDDQPVQTVRTRLRFGCTTFTIDNAAVHQDVNLCDITQGPATDAPDGALAAYLNGWVFEDRNGGNPFWLQNHVDPGVDRCPNGQAGTVQGRVYRAITNVAALDDGIAPLVAGVFRPTGSSVPANVRLGATTGATEASTDSVGASFAQTTQRYQIDPEQLPISTVPGGLGSYFVRSGQGTSPLGNPQAAPGAASNYWQAGSAGLPPSPDAGTLSRVQLVSGVELQQPSAAGGYDLGAVVNFVATLQHTCTGG